MRLGIVKTSLPSALAPLREAWGAPIIVVSGYRCAALNKAVGGVKNSQHMVGEAADILPRWTVRKFFENLQKFLNVKEPRKTPERQQYPSKKDLEN
ncbi:MAG: hypothetical protein IJ729_01500 [Alloprevotella sp.]|nr:hypothetical protein [Alloprevotella sp.]